MRFLFFISSWLPVGAWAYLIFYLSSIPSLSSGLGMWDLVLRKIAHVVEFAILTILLLRAMCRTWPEAVKTKILIGGGFLATLYAISDEIHQAFVPGRGPSAQDVLIDAVGVVAAVLIFRRRDLCRT